MGKKAQITVFMIIGIILLFSSALIVYIKNQVTAGLPAEFAPAVEEVPLEAQPIKLYVENCLNKIATEALIHAGAHGGYIDPSTTDYGRMFFAGPFPTESEALSVTGRKEGLVPYWWYLKSPNRCLEECQFESNKPPLTKGQGMNSLEHQAERYIKNNLGRCIQGFQTFEQQGFTITPKGDIVPEVRVTENDVAVLLEYPLDAERSGRTTEVKQYFTKVDISMKEIYNLANDIMQYEIDQKFIEYHSLNLVSFYSKPVSMERLPPMGHLDMGTDSGYLIWTKTETQQRMEANVLPPGISMLQVFNTGNFRRHIILDDEGVDHVATGYMDKAWILPNLTNQYETLEARFSYLDWWPIWLKINGGQEVLQPEKMGALVTGFLFDLIGMKNYRFYYSYSFPVLVTIKDPYALGGQGYSFNFAIEANVRKNAPMNASWQGSIPYPQPSMLCDARQRNAGPIKIEVKDKFTGLGIGGSNIEFIAGDESCFIATTELDGEGRTIVTEKFPVGIGEISVVKDGYLPVRMPIGAFLDEEGEYTIEMMPIFIVNATVNPLTLTYQQGVYILPQVPISSLSPQTESVVMTFSRIPDETYGEFESYLTYNATSGPQEMLLVPGKYEVNGFLMLNKQIVIPEETKTVPIPFMKSKVIKMNESVIDQWLAGGVMFNNITGYWEVTEEQLRFNSRVKFKILKWPTPTTHSREFGAGPSLEQVSEQEDASNAYRTELEPEWSQ
ncbi:TPA: hypothetical protein HA265_07790 [Candidatus Woesearchaeota archaeon]|nr:hypothetical protein [Candidatus Woesearchaeota archaeon]